MVFEKTVFYDCRRDISPYYTAKITNRNKIKRVEQPNNETGRRKKHYARLYTARAFPITTRPNHTEKCRKHAVFAKQLKTRFLQDLFEVL